jgi:LAS superfamily LD-carboxypeptidase LdcB
MEATVRRHRRRWADRFGNLPLLPGLSGLALALVGLLAPIGGGSLGSSTALALGPLPACRYDNIMTAPRGYADWRVTLVDPILRVPSTYSPPDLVPTSQAGLAGIGLVRKVAIADLKAMAAAARNAGSPIAVESAYRSYAQQQVTFKYWVDTLGYTQALKVSARPGHSEHQLGLAIDFKSEPGGAPWNGGDWAKTPAGAWMLANAWKYGWVLSYPKGAITTVCYDYEPWHYRYVGRDLAADIHASKLTIREYLWTNYTTAVVPPPTSPAPSTRPSHSALPSDSDLPTASSSPVPTTSPEPSPSVAPSASAPAAEATNPPGPNDPLSALGPNAVLAVAGAVLAVLAIVIAGGWLVRGRGRRR